MTVSRFQEESILRRTKELTIMKKTNKFLMVLLVLLVFVAGVAPTQGKYKMVWSFSDPPYAQMGELKTMHPIWAAGVALKGALFARVGDEIKVDLFHSGQTGSNEEVLEHVATGVQESVTLGEGDLARYFKPIQLIGMPYAFRSPVIAWEVIDGPFGDRLKEGLRQASGIRIIAAWDNGGFRQLVNSKRPIRSPADVKGLKIRTMMIPIHMSIIESWGGLPTPVSWNELYTAAETGVVDGFENNPINFITPKLYEVFDYMTLTSHVYGMLFILVNDKWFQSLPKHLQFAVLEAGKAAQAAGRGGARALETAAVDTILSKGIKVYVPKPSEMEQFRALAAPAGLKYLKENVSQDWIDDFLKAVEAAEKKFGYK
jgi:tripartite ATP-independent transporter DctP family solute receptor